MSYCAKRKRKEEIIGSCIIVVYASDSSFLQLVCYSSSIQVPSNWKCSCISSWKSLGIYAGDGASEERGE